MSNVVRTVSPQCASSRCSRRRAFHAGGRPFVNFARNIVKGWSAVRDREEVALLLGVPLRHGRYVLCQRCTQVAARGKRSTPATEAATEAAKRRTKTAAKAAAVPEAKLSRWAEGLQEAVPPTTGITELDNMRQLVSDDDAAARLCAVGQQGSTPATFAVVRLRAHLALPLFIASPSRAAQRKMRKEIVPCLADFARHFGAVLGADYELRVLVSRCRTHARRGVVGLAGHADAARALRRRRLTASRCRCSRAASSISRTPSPRAARKSTRGTALSRRGTAHPRR